MPRSPQEAQPAREGKPTQEGEEGNPQQAGTKEQQHREGGGAFLCEALKGGLQNWQRRRRKPSEPHHDPGLGQSVQEAAGRAGEEVFSQVSEVRERVKEHSKAKRPRSVPSLQLAFKLHLRVLHFPPIASYSAVQVYLYLYLGACETK